MVRNAAPPHPLQAVQWTGALSPSRGTHQGRERRSPERGERIEESGDLRPPEGVQGGKTAHREALAPTSAPPAATRCVAPYDFLPRAALHGLVVLPHEEGGGYRIDLVFRGRALSLLADEVDVPSDLRAGDEVSVLADAEARASIRKVQGGAVP